MCVSLEGGAKIWLAGAGGVVLSLYSNSWQAAFNHGIKLVRISATLIWGLTGQTKWRTDNEWYFIKYPINSTACSKIINGSPIHFGVVNHLFFLQPMDYSFFIPLLMMMHVLFLFSPVTVLLHIHTLNISTINQNSFISNYSITNLYIVSNFFSSP